MATRPTEALPDWVATGNRTEPDGSRKSSGHAAGEPLPAQHWNWLLYSISLWFTYLTTMWRSKTSISASTPLTLAHDGAILHVDTTGGAVSLTLLDPTTASGFTFKVRDVANKFGTNAVTLVRNGSEQINGLAADFVLDADGGEWTVFCDGTNYFV